MWFCWLQFALTVSRLCVYRWHWPSAWTVFSPLNENTACFCELTVCVCVCAGTNDRIWQSVRKWRGKKNERGDKTKPHYFVNNFLTKTVLCESDSPCDTVKHTQTEAYTIKDKHLTKNWQISAITLIHCSRCHLLVLLVCHFPMYNVHFFLSCHQYWWNV